MNSKLLFIFNPNSGQGRIRLKLVSIIDIFTRAGYEVTVHPTMAREDATNFIIERGADFDRIVCSGGDGTLDESVKAMLRLKPEKTLGYIPAGSTNDYAKTLGISSNMEKAAQSAVDGRVKKCDVGTFNGNPFVYIAAFGAFTEVSYETNQKAKNILGHMAYVLEGIRYVGMGNLKPIDMTIVADDRIIKDRFIYGMVANTLSVGGIKGITGKSVSLDDGKFEVVLVRFPEDSSEANTMMAALMAKEPDPEYFYYFKASEISFVSETPVAWTLDGENGGAQTDVEIRNLKQAVSFVVPL